MAKPSLLVQTAAALGAMPTLNGTCRGKTEVVRGHEFGDHPLWVKSMATPEPTQNMNGASRVAMAPSALPQRMATPADKPSSVMARAVWHEML
jgi:hypothetical protein